MEARPIAAALALLALAGCITPNTEPSAETQGGFFAPADLPCDHERPTQGGEPMGVMAHESNSPGAYSYSAQAAAATGQHEVAWRNPSGTSRVSWGEQSATGTLRIAIYDACGKKVYDETTGRGQEGGSRTLPLGEPGTWLVRFQYSAYTGQASFSLTS